MTSKPKYPAAIRYMRSFAKEHMQSDVCTNTELVDRSKATAAASRHPSGIWTTKGNEHCGELKVLSACGQFKVCPKCDSPAPRPAPPTHS